MRLRSAEVCKMVKLKIGISLSRKFADRVKTHKLIKQGYDMTKVKSIDEIKLMTLLSLDSITKDNYLKLFNYEKRLKLEKALLIYACHIKYLAAKLDIDESKMLLLPSWQKKYLPLIFNNVCNVLDYCLTNYNKSLIKNIYNKVNQDLLQICQTSLDPEFYIILTKGHY